MARILKCLWPLITLLIFGTVILANHLTDWSVHEVSEKYTIEITPSQWTFRIWYFVYFWQFLWIIYILALTLLYDMEIIIFGPWFWFSYNLANVFNSILLILWSKEELIASMIIIICMADCLAISTWISHGYMYKIDRLHQQKVSLKDDDDDDGLESDDTDNNNPTTTQQQILYPSYLIDSAKIQALFYSLIINGIPFYCATTVFSAIVNIGVVLVYDIEISDSYSSIITLSILTLIFGVQLGLDFGLNTKWYLQYTYSHYFALIILFIGVLDNVNWFNQLEENPSAYYTFIIFVIVCFAFCCKIILGCLLRNKNIVVDHQS